MWSILGTSSSEDRESGEQDPWNVDAGTGVKGWQKPFDMEVVAVIF